MSREEIQALKDTITLRRSCADYERLSKIAKFSTLTYKHSNLFAFYAMLDLLEDAGRLIGYSTVKCALEDVYVIRYRRA